MISGPNLVTSISISSTTSILGIAGYYTNYDGLQHVIVAAKDGSVYEVHWNQLAQVPPTVVPLEDLGSVGNDLVDIAGFFTLDDNLHHAVGITNDGTLHELYFSLGEAPKRSNLPYHIISFDKNKGAASFYSPGDNLRHVVIVDSRGNPVDITWNAQQPIPTSRGITIPPTDSQVVSISSFLAIDDNSRHIIVARMDTGQVYDIDYPDELHIPHDIRGQDQIYVRTSFQEQVKNVTAFFSPDTNYRHVVVLTEANLLKDHAYDTQGNMSSTVLTSSPLSDVQDITSFYSAYDGLRHVIFATKEGSLYEITYTYVG